MPFGFPESLVNIAHIPKLAKSSCPDYRAGLPFRAVSLFMIATYRSVWLAIIFQLRVRLVRMVASAPLSARSMRRRQSATKIQVVCSILYTRKDLGAAVARTP